MKKSTEELIAMHAELLRLQYVDTKQFEYKPMNGNLNKRKPRPGRVPKPRRDR